MDEEFAKQVNFKTIKLPVQKKIMQKLKNKIKLALADLLIKIKIRTVFIT